ncbi:MAG: glycosyltransferase family 4 protein [Actinomycetota bacterium]|nr:glycosyltransferase family 4 protein [Actinomycetota bacterium]
MSGARVARAAEIDRARATPNPLQLGIALLSHNPGQFTGTGTYVRGILAELGRLGADIEVEVLCNEHAREFLGGLSRANVAVRQAHGFRVGGSRVSRMAAITGAIVRPGLLVGQFSAGVQVIHYPLTIAVPRTRLPTVVTLHDVQHHEMPEYFSPLQRQWRRSFYDGGALRATMVVADSDHARERIIAILGIAPEQVVAIHLGVDHERFRPDSGPDDERLLKPFALPQRFVLYPATLWPHKNHIGLLDALARIDDGELHLLLTGAPLGRLNEILAEAAKRGLEHRVRHLRVVPEGALPALYRAATALVFPSRYEGFGAPPLEAMACGCPVASSLVASLREVCGDAVTELNPDDAAQMAIAIERVCGDRALRERLTELGIAQAKRFSWATAAEAHIAVYRRAVELGPRSRAMVG